jgi:hypothetical protein
MDPNSPDELSPGMIRQMLMAVALFSTVSSFLFYQLDVMFPGFHPITVPLHYISLALGLTANAYVVAQSFFGSWRTLPLAVGLIPAALTFSAYGITFLSPELAQLLFPLHSVGFGVLCTINTAVSLQLFLRTRTIIRYPTLHHPLADEGEAPTPAPHPRPRSPTSDDESEAESVATVPLPTRPSQSALDEAEPQEGSQRTAASAAVGSTTPTHRLYTPGHSPDPSHREARRNSQGAVASDSEPTPTHRRLYTPEHSPGPVHDDAADEAAGTIMTLRKRGERDTRRASLE